MCGERRYFILENDDHSVNPVLTISFNRDVSIAPETYPRSLKLRTERKANPRLGSFPATCQPKCNQCKPCVPVEVTIKTMAEEENEYYPIAWMCTCQSNIFSP
ncbi:EPIDERMAL PATTERNING FACTOR-like protein 4 [Glycine max]|uniref:Epidermal patterning factor-like protein n=1 Tax=Glycine soja TaxID=3848 RepID=A0A445HUU7_GLYSO|nr:EPIDERMAL PATTERNING FACTOR-like protein 4 [Glycine max]RZB77558.1 hypothetical protein D0Y65_028555 [Glycine soja]